MLRTPGARDEVEDKIRIIQEAKALAMNINDKRGLCMLTPVQGSRKGWKEAGGKEAYLSTDDESFSGLDPVCALPRFDLPLPAQNADLRNLGAIPLDFQVHVRLVQSGFGTGFAAGIDVKRLRL